MCYFLQKEKLKKKVHCQLWWRLKSMLIRVFYFSTLKTKRKYVEGCEKGQIQGWDVFKKTSSFNWFQSSQIITETHSKYTY